MSRLGASVALVEGMDHVLPREPKPLGEALGEALPRKGSSCCFGQHASAARRDGDDYVLDVRRRQELRGDRLLVATGRRPRIDGLGLETVGVEPDPHGIPVDDRMNVTEGVWAIGDVTGVWPLTYVGKYQGRVAAANILGQRRDRQLRRRAARRLHGSAGGRRGRGGRGDGDRAAGRGRRARPPTRARMPSGRGFLTLVSDGERLTGAYAVGPEAGEWLGQATLAIRARVPLEVLNDTIQPFPTFSEAFLYALQELGARLQAAA